MIHGREGLLVKDSALGYRCTVGEFTSTILRLFWCTDALILTEPLISSAFEELRASGFVKTEIDERESAGKLCEDICARESLRVVQTTGCA